MAVPARSMREGGLLTANRTKAGIKERAGVAGGRAAHLSGVQSQRGIIHDASESRLPAACICLACPLSPQLLE